MKSKALRAMGVITFAVTITSCGQAVKDAGGAELMGHSTSNRRAIAEVVSHAKAGTYARSNQYYGYDRTRLVPGMRVMFSASYGAGGGEAGQARGVLVQGENGDLYFKPEANTTTQLMLAPGQTFEQNRGSSLWNISQYLELVNQVAFNDGLTKSGAPGETYTKVGAALVDFTGGTASRQVTYQDVLELNFVKGERGIQSKVDAFYSKATGAVAMEFRETGLAAGTFKLYIADNAGSR